MKRASFILAAALLAFPLAAPANTATPRAEAWEIGPLIKGRNYSVNMPLRPVQTRDGLRISFPNPDRAAGHAHYVTFRHGPLEGKRRIVMRYRIDAAPGTRFVPQEYPDRPATLSLFFQRRGDTWTARGRYEYYRWYAPRAKVAELAPGEHTISIELSENWISVFGKTPAAAREAFNAALADTDRVGFVMGSAGGRGHGVFTTAPATLTVLSFEVQ